MKGYTDKYGNLMVDGGWQKSCPFIGPETQCGAWCTHFEVVPESKTYPTLSKHILIHCTGTTRSIDWEEPPKAEEKA